MININTLNQNNNYSLGRPNISTPFSTLAMGETTTTTGNVGTLIPIYCKELQPSQTINTSQTINIQFTPFVTNLMHQVKGEIISYFVPYRLLWDKWEDFVTGGDSGVEAPTMPTTSILDIMDKVLKNPTDTFDQNLKAQILKETKLLNESFTKIINDYALQGHLNEKAAATIAQQFAQYLIGILTNTTVPDDVVNEGMPGRAGIWYKVINNIQTGKPYKKYGELENATAREMNHFQKIIDMLFLHTQWDYLGLPYTLTHLILWVFKQSTLVNTNPAYQGIKDMISIAFSKKVMTLPFEAYTKIYNDWIRLSDWEDEIKTKPYTLEQANYDWDYFTRARRYQIRGAMPTIPVLGGQKFKIGNERESGVELVEDGGTFKFKVGSTILGKLELDYIYPEKGLTGSIQESPQYTNFTDVMTAAALMNYFTANARIRPRYAEHLLARWNVRIQDARLQLSEFIGVNSISISSQGVVQTSASQEGTTRQGNITGQLWGNGSGLHTGYKAQEHGVVLSLLVIKPANSYELGYPMWMRKNTRFDMPIPEMVNLPDMPIFCDELDPFSPANAIIGYKAIYDEYRTTVNKVTGRLRPSSPTGLASYTLARYIHNPSIGKLAKCIPNLNPIKQYLEEPDFILIIGTQTQTAIPLPYTSDVKLMS